VVLLSACASQPAAIISTAAIPEAVSTMAPTNASGTIDEDSASEQPTGAGEVAPDTAIPDALIDVLGNLSYSGLFPEKEITLKDGTYEYSEGGVGTPHVRLIDRQIVLGDLNEDGAQDAVILLEDDSEGTGRFTFLVAVLNVLTEPTPVEAIMVGDRIGVNSLTVDGSQVGVDIVAQGPGDVDCCASWNVRTIYTLEGGRLVEQSWTELNQISLDDLDGTQWRLIDLNVDQEAVLPDTEITLRFDDGQISGSAGCNDYSGIVNSGEYGLNSLEVSPIAATEMQCSDPVSDQENTFLTRLGNAESWRYDYGHLSLRYPLEESVVGELQFAPQEENMMNANQTKPNAVTELEAAYGAPSQAGFGSAVFYEQMKSTDDLEQMALEKYKYFVGELWERYGQEAWMGPWKEVYTRESNAQRDIVAELRGIQDGDAALSVPMILDNIEGAEKARAALSAAYDDPAMTDLQVYNLGDGGAMSGLLIAGRHNETGEAIFLVFLLD
jgi:heat shock protein HslJ